MKLIILGILIYAGYRLISPTQDRQLDDKKNRAIDEEDYIDYEEVD